MMGVKWLRKEINLFKVITLSERLGTQNSMIKGVQKWKKIMKSKKKLWM